MSSKPRKKTPFPEVRPRPAIIWGYVLMAVGIAILVPSAVNLHRYLRMREAEKVEAKVLSVKRTTSSSGRGSTFVHVEATYSYRKDGQTYTGTRVALFNDARHWEDELRKAMDSGQSITAWIDPSDPSNAIIDREWRWWSLLPDLIPPAGFIGFAIRFFHLAVIGLRPAPSCRQSRRRALRES